MFSYSLSGQKVTVEGVNKDLKLVLNKHAVEIVDEIVYDNPVSITLFIRDLGNTFQGSNINDEGVAEISILQQVKAERNYVFITFEWPFKFKQKRSVEEYLDFLNEWSTPPYLSAIYFSEINKSFIVAVTELISVPGDYTPRLEDLYIKFLMSVSSIQNK